MIARALIRATAATLPFGVRERYREEWIADAAAASEANVSPWSVVAGALGVTAGIDRDDPVVSGIPAQRLAFRRLRVTLAFAVTAVMLMVLGWMVGAFGPAGSAPLAGAGVLLLALAAGAALVALIAGFGALRAGRRARGRRRWGMGQVVVIVSLVLVAAVILFAPFVAALLPIAVVFAFLVALAVLLAGDPRAQGAPLSRPRAVGIALLSAVGVLAALTCSLLHVYVWNPLARLPGMTLDEIYAGLVAARELPTPVFPVVVATFWCLAVVALVVLCALPHPGIRRLATARRIAGAGVLGVALVAGGTWMLGFGMGMGMADAFATSGGDAAVSGPVLTVVGTGFAVAAAMLGLLPSRLRPLDPAQPAEAPPAEA